jgi:hypothetical protein
VTWKVAVTAVPEGTEVNCVGLVAVAVQPCGSCSASRTSGIVSSPEADSCTCTVEAWPGCIADGALTTTCRAAGVAPIVNVPCSGRPEGAEESPR